MKTVYYTDGTPLSFFTAVFLSFKDQSAYLTSSKFYQTEFGETWIAVKNDESKAERVVKKLKTVDFRAFQEIDWILRTQDSEKEQIGLEYIRLVLKFGKHAREKLHIPTVRQAIDLSSKVGKEIHRLHGFLRFEECENGVFYAPCSPDNNVIDLLTPHFLARFKNTAFVIHDVQRELAVLAKENAWVLTSATTADFSPSEQENEIARLWTEYYHTVAIPMRKNTRQMKNYMPVRYWKYLTEKQGDDI